MKKFILLVFLSSCTITFAQDKEKLTGVQLRELRAKEKQHKRLIGNITKIKRFFFSGKSQKSLCPIYKR